MADHRILIFAVFAIIIISVVIWLITKAREGFTTANTQPPLFQTIQNTTTTTTTVPVTIKSSSAGDFATNQRANVIYYGTTSDNKITPIADSSEYGTKDMKNVVSISLAPDSEPFIIKQISISGITTTSLTPPNRQISSPSWWLVLLIPRTIRYISRD